MPNWGRDSEFWKFGGRGMAMRARWSWILTLVLDVWIFWLRYFRPTSMTMKNKVAHALAAIEPVFASDVGALTTSSRWFITAEPEALSTWHWWLITIPAEKIISARALANLATPYLVLNMSQRYQVIPWHHGRVSNTWKIHTGFSGVTWRTSLALGLQTKGDLIFRWTREKHGQKLGKNFLQ